MTRRTEQALWLASITVCPLALTVLGSSFRVGVPHDWMRPVIPALLLTHLVAALGATFAVPIIARGWYRALAWLAVLASLWLAGVEAIMAWMAAAGSVI
jgi:hypothetical protein